MDEANQRPIEVELTAHDPAGAGRRRRFGRRDAEPAPDTSTDPAPHASSPGGTGSLVGEGAGIPPVEAATTHGEPPSPDTSRRTVTIATAAAVVGLAAGWLLGTGGSGDPASAPTVSSPTSDTAIRVEEPADPALEPIDTVRAPTTTRPPRTTTTTTEPAAEVGLVSLHPAIAGADVEIVGLVDNVETAVIDAATGEMTSWRWNGYVDPFTLTVGADWVVVGDQNSGRSRIMTSDGEVSVADLGEVWNLLHVPGTDTFWRGADRDRQTGSFRTFELVDVAGTPTGPVIDVAGNWPFGVDPAGGLITIAQGKSYSIRPEGVEFVVDGELVAISTDVAVARSCDERLACGLVVVDRVTGDQRFVEVPDELLTTTGFSWGPPLQFPISPDGSKVPIVLGRPAGPDLALIDLLTGDSTLISERTTSFATAWTPDGAALLLVEDGVPLVYDVATRFVEPLGEGLEGWTTIDVRPATR